MSTRRRRLATALTAIALLGGGPGAAVAAAACPQTSVADVEDEVMCPVCGTPLSLAAEAPQAKREREFILERVERCQSKEEIKTALAAEFGEDVLATPDDEGFDLAAYLVPALALLAGAAAVAVALVRWRGGAGRRGDGSDTATGTVPPPDAEGRARLEDDLRRYDL